jgi:predicted metal-dependent enzyme (double-stranded beta helix superfamily)
VAISVVRVQHYVMGFDLDMFIADCLAAASDRAGVAEVVERAIRDRSGLEHTLTRKLDLSSLGILHYSEHLTVQHIVFPPAYRTGIHDHLTWAVIGTWSGYEDNHLFVRDGSRVVETRVQRVEPGQTITLDGDAIHDVHAPPSTGSAALHVYGGPLFDQPRHAWNPEEGPVDDAADLERMLAALRATGRLSEQN